MKRPLPLILLSLALVAVAADLAQWAALEYYVNLYPVEYTLFYLLSALALTRAGKPADPALARGGGAPAP